MRHSKLLVALLGLAAASSSAHAITILTGPTFTNVATAPLVCVLKLTTDQPSRVSVSVSDGTNTWDRNFYDFATTHAIPLLGFKPSRTNTIAVTVRDKFRNETNAMVLQKFVTGALPANFPKLTLLESKPEMMEPGYTLLRLVNNNPPGAYITAVDSNGEVVWYMTAMTGNFEVQQLKSGNLFFPLTSGFSEINMLGQTVKTWGPASGLAVNNHDGFLTDRGTILYLNDASRVVTNFPTSATNSNAPHVTTNLLVNQIVEMAATNSLLLNLWPLIDLLAPTRINYLTFSARNGFGWDAQHANAIIEDPRDDSIIVSLRHQDAVVKFSRLTGQLKWILGPHENWPAAFQPYLLTPVGTPFEWNYAQHAPKITPQGTLLVYDNGNFRASPFATSVPDAQNYTRAVEYDINETTMEVSQVWEYGSADEPLFTDRVGNVEWLPQQGNVLITFGNVNYVNGIRPSTNAPQATMLRIKEVTHEPTPEVVFDLMAFDYSNTNASYGGCFAYRSHRIPDLYAHSAKPVADLAVTHDGALAHLSFSGDPARTYVIEGSTNLIDWAQLPDGLTEVNGEFECEDADSIGYPARYYRVIAQ